MVIISWFINCQSTNFVFIIFKTLRYVWRYDGNDGQVKRGPKKIEETKKRLDTVMVDESSSDNLLKVTLTANREFKSITIADELLEDKEQLEDYLILTLNKAIQKATEVNESELGAAAREGMPDIPGL